MTGRQEVFAKSHGKKRVGATIAIRGPGLEVVHPHAAGIDVGNTAHYVAGTFGLIVVSLSKLTTAASTAM
jgi:hypothetical protein